MKMKHLSSLLVLSGIILGSIGIAGACDGMGPGKHVGPVLAINTEEKSFTIRDAQSGDPITFEATVEILKGLTVAERVLVSYKDSEGKLIAQEIGS